MSEFPLYTDERNQPVNCSVLRVGSGSPHVVMTALQHGNETVGLEAGLLAMQELQGKTIGAVTLLTCLNPDGFHNQTREAFSARATSTNPGANMNRQHPGDRHGTLAERIAAAVDEKIQSLEPDFVIDLHSYAHQSVPHVILDHASDETSEVMRRIAARSGLPTYLDFEPDSYGSQALDKSLSAIWARRDIPAFTIELGPQGGFSKDQAQRAAEAVRALLGACGVCEFVPVKHPTTKAMARVLRGKEWQRVGIVSDSDASGYARHVEDIGTVVERGQVLGAIVGLDGGVHGEIVAPEDGVVFIWSDDPRVYPGAVAGVLLRARGAK